MSALEPVIVITRHPDYADEVNVYGAEVKIVYIDLGSSFTITPDDVEQAREWADDTWADLADLPADHPARAEVLDVIGTTVEDYFKVALDDAGKLVLNPLASEDS